MRNFVGGVRAWVTYLGSQNVVHGKDVDFRIHGEWRLDLGTDDGSSGKFGELLDMAPGSDDTLEGHVTSSAKGADVGFLIVRSKHAVLDTGANEAVRLTVHGLRSKGSGYQVDLAVASLVAEQGLSLGGPLHNFHLDAGVLLGTDTLTILTVVVHTGLTVLGAVDSVAFTELDFAQFVEFVDLPAHEGVIVGVGIGSEEASSPVNSSTKCIVVILKMIESIDRDDS